MTIISECLTINVKTQLIHFWHRYKPSIVMDNSTINPFEIALSKCKNVIYAHRQNTNAIGPIRRQ
jgi:hypothetical protein